MGGGLGGVPATPMIVFFTYRVSLGAWAERGIVERETELYRRLLPHVGSVAFVTSVFGMNMAGVVVRRLGS